MGYPIEIFSFHDKQVHTYTHTHLCARSMEESWTEQESIKDYCITVSANLISCAVGLR